MTEDELLAGVLGALAAGGWRYQHIRRSDRAIVQGWPGWPDIVAVHPENRTVLALECKAQDGALSPGQRDWITALRLANVDCRVVRPRDYDQLVVELVGDRLVNVGGRRVPAELARSEAGDGSWSDAGEDWRDAHGQEIG